jgi:uncharacterized protein (DUF983 family)
MSAPGAAGDRRERIGAELFPAPPGVEGGAGAAERGRSRMALALVGLVVLGALLVVLRLGTGTFERVWAEDGPVYLAGAVGHDFFHALFTTYAGYLVFVPRLIGALAGTILPLGWAAAIVVVLSALLTALCGVAVWFGAAGQVSDRRLRAGLVVAATLAAAAGQETLDSAAYVPWFMLFATFWLLFLHPRTTAGAGAAGAFALLTGLSTPGVWFFAPVAILRALSRPTRKAWIVLAGYAAGALAQVPVVLTHEQGPSLYSGRLWAAFLQRVVDGGLLGQRLGGQAWEKLGWPFVIVLTLALIVGLALALRRAPRGSAWCALILLATALVMFVVSVYQRAYADQIFWHGGQATGLASRYVLVPAVFLVSAVVVAIGGALRGEWGRALAPRTATRIVAATVAALLLVVAISFDMSYSSGGVPPWRDALRQSGDECLESGQEVIGVPTEPSGFGAVVRCTEVEGFASGR